MSILTKKDQLLAEAKARYEKARERVALFQEGQWDSALLDDEEKQPDLWDLQDRREKAREIYQCRRRMDDWIDKDTGKLIFCDWGGYPAAYLDKDNSVLCSDCAQESLESEDEIPAFRPKVGFIHQEGDLWCDKCSKMIWEEEDDEEKEEGDENA